MFHRSHKELYHKHSLDKGNFFKLHNRKKEFENRKQRTERGKKSGSRPASLLAGFVLGGSEFKSSTKLVISLLA